MAKYDVIETTTLTRKLSKVSKSDAIGFARRAHKLTGEGYAVIERSTMRVVYFNED